MSQLCNHRTGPPALCSCVDFFLQCSVPVRFEGRSVTGARMFPASIQGVLQVPLWEAAFVACSSIQGTVHRGPIVLGKGTRCQLLNLLYKIHPQSDELDWNFGNKWLVLVIVTEMKLSFLFPVIF